jgi:hypothetical protein
MFEKIYKILLEDYNRDYYQMSYGKNWIVFLETPEFAFSDFELRGYKLAFTPTDLQFFRISNHYNRGEPLVQINHENGVYRGWSGESLLKSKVVLDMLAEFSYVLTPHGEELLRKELLEGFGGEYIPLEVRNHIESQQFILKRLRDLIGSHLTSDGLDIFDSFMDGKLHKKTREGRY